METQHLMSISRPHFQRVGATSSMVHQLALQANASARLCVRGLDVSINTVFHFIRTRSVLLANVYRLPAE